MIVRASTEADAEAIAAIYGHHVLHGLASFEEVPPTAADMAGRRAEIVALGLPHVVAEEDGVVLGYAYAGAFRPRAAYRYTVEDSVYVAPEAIGKGVGRAVLAEVLKACEALGVRQVMAVIGNSANDASIGLHAAMGFKHAGVCRSVGFKHGQWLDTVWMQKELNGGDSRAPDRPGLHLDGH